MCKTGAVSIAGLISEQDPKLNQDYALSARTQSGNIVVVSDGAGSKKHSAIGSKCICRTVIRTLQNDHQLNDAERFSELIISAVEKSLNVLRRFSNIYRLDANITDFSATLLVAFQSGNHCFCAHLGDGVCMFFNAEDELIKISLPDNGEYINETFFVTDKDWAGKLRCFKFMERKVNCLIMSDGVTPFALHNDGPFFKFTKPLLKYLKTAASSEATTSVATILSSPEARKVSKDDKSIAWWISC